MAKKYDRIDDGLREFIEAQPIFFVATAPLDPEGHVNLSPKGLNRVAVLDQGTVAYLDLTGSGVETIAHLRENGRIVVMLCAFDGPPRIVRLHGRGEAILPADRSFAALAAHFPPSEAVRSIIRVKVERIADSCGFGVPLMEYQGERPQMDAWIERKGGRPGVVEYQQQKNTTSIDALPGLAEVESR
jgi:predicted pyridoxine 5'-phosphate oxidase superfamily flavin-nucleotide-binding protein